MGIESGAISKDVVDSLNVGIVKLQKGEKLLRMALVFIVCIPVVALLFHQIATISKHTVNVSDEHDIAMLRSQLRRNIGKNLLNIEAIIKTKFGIYSVKGKVHTLVQRIDLVLDSFEIARCIVNQRSI